MSSSYFFGWYEWPVCVIAQLRLVFEGEAYVLVCDYGGIGSLGRRLGGGGGYVSWDHFLLQFTEVFIGVGDAIVLNIVGICKVLPIVSMRRA